MFKKAPLSLDLLTPDSEQFMLFGATTFLSLLTKATGFCNAYSVMCFSVHLSYVRKYNSIDHLSYGCHETKENNLKLEACNRFVLEWKL